MMKNHRISDRGIALPTVMMVMLLVVSFASIVLTLATSQAKTEATYEKSVKALHAAEAGINEYLLFLNSEKPDPINLNPTSYPSDHPEYFYDLEEIDVASLGRKIIKSTGWVYGDDTVKRSVEVTFTKRSYTEYVYLSNKESFDDVTQIFWTAGEKCYGPYRTNGQLCIEGNPIFFGKVIHTLGIVPGSNYAPIFKAGVSQEESLPLPENNKKLSILARQPEGYYFTGQTRINLNSSGTLTIRNVNTNYNNPYTVPLPKNGVIYVDGGTTDNIFSVTNGNVFVSGCLAGRLTISAANNIYVTDYDPTLDSINDYTTQSNGITYKDTYFTVDTVSGKVEDKGSKKDMLGLIALKNVGVLTKGWFNDASKPSAKGDIQINAAIMAVEGSLGNTSYSKSYPDGTLPSPKGELIIRGSIIQKMRGVVGYGTTLGYNKNYAHDPRMLYDSPPHFLEPANSGWEIGEWKER